MKLKRTIKWKRQPVILAGLILLISIGGWWWWQQKQEADKEVTTTVTVERDDLKQTITLSGQIEQANQLSVFTKASGVVKAVFVTDGQTVKAGQLTSQATMLTEWEQYYNKSQEETYKDPHDTDRTAPEFINELNSWQAAEINYQAAATGIQSAQASQQQAWYNYTLYQAKITAPVDGTIIGLNLVPGLTVAGSTNSSGGAVSQTVVTLKTTGTPVAAFTATEVDINQLVSGQGVAVTLASFEDKTVTGRVAAIDRVGTTTNNVTQYGVLVRLDNPDEEILTNMAVSGEIVLDQRENVLVLPLEAINTRGDKAMVIKMVKGQPTPTEVTTGLETETQVEIVAGLNEGETVLVSNGTATSSRTGERREQFMFMGGPPAGGPR
ncbi:hypothetical protein A2W24_03930 [Microgenomates group bacterium RBG_16_45_19]|nr:MAG: hypothetical protein A2W24_03930 [Microgenomates group bacterium RBG_16_45_19]